MLASLIQSNGTTSQLISARPCTFAAANTASLISPPAVRKIVGLCPIAAAMASPPLDSWLGISVGGTAVMLACSQVWLPISMPASATRLAQSGCAATLLPIMKKVALESLSCKMCTSRSVYGVGPSSKVSATHLNCAQSTASGSASLTWPVIPPATSTAATPQTPNTVRQYGHAGPSGLL